eukprot:Lithocolla_globosa_v1_NODE_1800_length_2328_cov_9.605807.p1 type:complete len:380 gc:universal NODE_1800_length_2328_cov_9.605807:1079-2218(+)
MTLLKPGKDEHSLDSYRPITLIENTAKLFEKVFHRRFQNIILPRIHQEQTGFQAMMGSREQLFTLSEAIKEGTKGHGVFVAFLDIKKAFDSVPHDALLQTLWSYGITGKAWNIFSNWYQNLKASVTADGSIFEVVTGTSILSPFFFLIWINDLITELKREERGILLSDYQLCCLLLADDVAILTDNEFDMHHLLKVASDFISRHGMSFNQTKSQWMFFPGAKKVTNVPILSQPFLLGSQPLTYTTEYKYLGIVFSSKHAHFLDLALTRRFFAAKATIDSFRDLIGPAVRHQQRMEIYLMYVRPVLEYGLMAIPLLWKQLQRLKPYERALLNDIGCPSSPAESLEVRIKRLRSKMLFEIYQNAPHTCRGLTAHKIRKQKY